MVFARCRARMRRWTRPWLKGLGKLLPRRAERELFGPFVRYFDKHHDCYGAISTRDSGSRERAAALLAYHLTGLQRRCLRRRSFFIVTGKSGRRFRVWARRQLPVELIDSRNYQSHHEPRCYCITNALSEDGAILPLADYLLELKLCLEAAEEYFVVTSNPQFKEGLIEKNELLRKTSSTQSGSSEAS
jgi:hypothetical protein